MIHWRSRTFSVIQGLLKVSACLISFRLKLENYVCPPRNLCHHSTETINRSGKKVYIILAYPATINILYPSHTSTSVTSHIKTQARVSSVSINISATNRTDGNSNENFVINIVLFTEKKISGISI